MIHDQPKTVFELGTCLYIHGCCHWFFGRSPTNQLLGIDSTLLQ